MKDFIWNVVTHSRKNLFKFCWFFFEYRLKFIIRYNFSRWNFALNFDRMSNVKISSNIAKTQKSTVLSTFVFRSVFCSKTTRRRFAISSIFFCKTSTKFEIITSLKSVILKMITLFVAFIEIYRMISWFFERTLWEFFVSVMNVFSMSSNFCDANLMLYERVMIL